MYIAVRCLCGKRIVGSAALAGEAVHCSRCRRQVVLPALYPTLVVAAAPAKDPAAPDVPYIPLEQPSPPVPLVPAEERPLPPRSWRDYVYWGLLAALVPLVVSIFQDKPIHFERRLAQTLENHPHLKPRADEILEEDGTLDELLLLLPGKRLDGRAHLSRDTPLHWLYAAAAACGFLGLILFLFAPGVTRPVNVLWLGVFAGTVGVVFVFVLHGASALFGFDLLSVLAAQQTKASLIPSLLENIFLVGLFEELCKALPLFWLRRQLAGDWRKACLWGLASGVGFGVSEGIFYSAEIYNGIAGADAYAVRFLSCVALHAIWSASVGIALSHWAKSVSLDIDSVFFGQRSVGAFAVPLLRVLGIAMVLHGLYDTFLEKEYEGLALLAALASFVWLSWQIETRREREEKIAASEVIVEQPA